jgi:hypothetical protein
MSPSIGISVGEFPYDNSLKMFGFIGQATLLVIVGECFGIAVLTKRFDLLDGVAVIANQDVAGGTHRVPVHAFEIIRRSAFALSDELYGRFLAANTARRSTADC